MCTSINRKPLVRVDRVAMAIWPQRQPLNHMERAKSAGWYRHELYKVECLNQIDPSDCINTFGIDWLCEPLNDRRRCHHTSLYTALSYICALFFKSSVHNEHLCFNQI